MYENVYYHINNPQPIRDGKTPRAVNNIGTHFGKLGKYENIPSYL